MLPALFALAGLILLALVVLLLRKPAAFVPDTRLSELLGTLPPQLARLEASTGTRLSALDQQLRADLSSLRVELAAEAQRTRSSTETASVGLREEVARSISALGAILNSGLMGFRSDNKSSDDLLRRAVLEQLDTLAQRLSAFTSEQSQHHMDSREALHNRLTELGNTNTEHLDRVRSTVEERLIRLNTDNAAKLEEMRATVDEKLHATLHTRLTESFGQVTDQLSKVHSGLGEMSKLSEGVDDLSRIFTNVKSRGGFAEVQLGMLLQQMLAPSQFVRNARVKLNTQEVVEFAVRFPGHAGGTLLPIDAKFPREDWERLEHAYTEGSADEIAAAGRSFEAAIRTEGKRICEKYIEPPITTPHAIMFLPTEGLYAEVMRRDGLQSEIQNKCHVTIAGPSTLSAILTSFQMGFHMLAIQEKGDEVWKVLASTRSEFGKFEKLMDSMEKQVGTVQNSIQSLGVRTRAINKTLRAVGESESPADNLLSFDGVAPLLAANGEDL